MISITQIVCIILRFLFDKYWTKSHIRLRHEEIILTDVLRSFNDFIFGQTNDKGSLKRIVMIKHFYDAVSVSSMTQLGNIENSQSN